MEQNVISDYRPQLDGLRAVCIIVTVGNHLAHKPWWLNGSMGVDVFFALSGWLITWLILKEISTKGALDLRAFYVRRVFRIAPLYFLTFALYFLAANVSGRSGDISDLQHAAPYLLSFNSEYRPELAGNIFGHAWTLGIEEKFYILWPAAMFLFPGRLGVAIAGSAACAAALVFIASGSPLVIRGYLGLGFGAAFAVFVAKRGAPEILFSERFALAMVGAIGATYLFSIFSPARLFWNVIVSFFAAGLVASMWVNSSTNVARILAFSPVAWLGKLTFGLYLTHVLVLNVVQKFLEKVGLGAYWMPQFLVGYGASILLAWALFSKVEHPLIQLGRRLAKKPVRMGVSS